MIRKTREEAEQIKKDAAAEAARMVEKESIVIAAKKRAQEIVEEAQQKIVNVIRNLEDKGEIVVARGGKGDEMIV